MNNPWGISGPEFLWLYAGGFVVAVITTLLLRRRARSGTAAPTGHEPVTAEEAAYLSGGRLRTVEAAIAGLIERNVIRVERSGKLYPVVGGTEPLRSEVERLAVSTLRQRPGRSVTNVQHALVRDPVFDEIQASLVARGLLYDGGRVYVSIVPLAVLAVIGVARLINGAMLGFPVGFLLVMLVVTLVAILVALRQVKPGPTAAARTVLSGIPATDAATTVASGGLGAYPDRDTARAFRSYRPAAAWSTSGGSFYYGAEAVHHNGSSCGGGSSSGSSCGGSSGGGCGGGGS